jgi:hypothetical protein
MRDPIPFCYDLVDHPEVIKKHLTVLNELYHKYLCAFSLNMGRSRIHPKKTVEPLL